MQKGRGAQYNSLNRFDKNKLVYEHVEGLDEAHDPSHKTQITYVYPKTILNEVESADLFDSYSINAYQGCEHGCIYCYARPTHEYLGYSAGLDFESKIMVKKNVVTLLEDAFNKKSYQPKTLMLSGNTDCYQPIEREHKLTRGILLTALKYKNPVGIITKNTLVLRDLDVLIELAKLNLLLVSVSIISLDEDLRLMMEPRTSTYKRRVQLITELTKAGIPVHVMIAPVIPAINDHEIPKIIQTVAEAGALGANYSMVRLNGSLGELFTQWIEAAMPDRAEKVLKQIREVHGGHLYDSRPGVRMRGEGKIAETINMLYQVSKNKYFKDKKVPSLDKSLFSNDFSGQMKMF